MKATIRDLYLQRDGRQILAIETSEDLRQLVDELAAGEIEVTIKRWKPKRSLDANAYCWVLLDALAEKLNLDKIEIYKEAIRHIGGVSEIVCVREKDFDGIKKSWESHGIGWQMEGMDSKIPGCRNAILYAGSSTYDTRQMSQLIDLLIRECEEQGIPTIRDEEVEKLIARWGRKESKNA